MEVVFTIRDADMPGVVAVFFCQLDHRHDIDTCVPLNIALGDN